MALWHSRGELVNRDSEWFPLRNALFDLPPYKGRWPQIWVAAHGPRMLRITGRHADAWFPAFIFRPKDHARALETVLSAASDAGRDPAAVTPAVLLAVVTGRTEGDVDEALDSVGTKMYGLTASAEIWARHGAAPRWAPILLARKTFNRKRWTERRHSSTPQRCRGPC